MYIPRYFAKLLILVMWFLGSKTCSAVIYKLNETEYRKFPPIFRVDPYDNCMQDPEGMYCYTQAALVSDEPSSLMDLLTEYSAFTVSHYNHTLLRYNLCVTKECTEFFNNTTVDQVLSLEACLNKSLHDEYGLKAKVLENKLYCTKASESVQTNIIDMCMFALIIGICILNTVGSIYDIFFTTGKNGSGNVFMTSFSMRRNWRNLMSTYPQGADSRLERLKCLFGFKVVYMVCVILAHSNLSSLFFIDNTQFIEDLYKNVAAQFPMSGTVVVHTFFVLSGLLLTYNLELMSERPGFINNWWLLPKGILFRWIRLTPVYAFVLFFTITINKYVITGPHAYVLATTEMNDCKRWWWRHLLYINNYNDQSQCMPQTWYLDADTQLYVLGLIIYITCRSATSRKLALLLLMVVAVAISVAHTYWQDLDGILVTSPETILSFFVSYPTFTHLYKRGHTNAASFLVGMAVGFLAYQGQKINFDARKYRKYLPLFYSILPLACLMIYSGKVYFNQGAPPSIGVRMLFAAYQKPVWAFFMGIWILAGIFQYEGIMSGLLELDFWRPLSRISYCAYLVHIGILRMYIAAYYLPHITYLSTVQTMIFILVTSYAAALLCWLLIEEPFSRLMTSLLRKKLEQNEQASTDVTKKDIEENEKRVQELEEVTTQ